MNGAMKLRPADHPTDADLVARTLAGDISAFEALVRRYRGLAFGLAYHQLGRFEDAEDAARDAMVEAYACDEQGFGLKITRADVTELKDNTFFALLTVEGNGQVETFDARLVSVVPLGLGQDAATPGMNAWATVVRSLRDVKDENRPEAPLNAVPAPGTGQRTPAWAWAAAQGTAAATVLRERSGSGPEPGDHSPVPERARGSGMESARPPAPAAAAHSLEAASTYRRQRPPRSGWPG
jgi:hypothetical protein